MARSVFNSIGTDIGAGIVEQAERTITEKSDGQLEGTVEWVLDSALLPLVDKVGEEHPDDSRLEMFQRSLVYNALGQVEVTAQYIGLKDDPTVPVASYAGGSGQDPITTNPQFRFFAGDHEETTDTEPWYLTEGTGDEAGFLLGRHGARFDLETKEFVGFVDPADRKAGMTTYFTTGDQVTVTYWTKTLPDFDRKGKIFTTWPHASIDVNTEVVDWYLLDMPVDKVGLLYRVTEVFIGSGISEGWDQDVYPTFGESAKSRTEDETIYA